MYDPVITIRLPSEIVSQIDALISEGDFGSRAEFVKYAVRQILKKYEGRSPPPLGMIERVAAGDVTTPTAKGRHSLSPKQVFTRMMKGGEHCSD